MEIIFNKLKRIFSKLLQSNKSSQSSKNNSIKNIVRLKIYLIGAKFHFEMSIIYL